MDLFLNNSEEIGGGNRRCTTACLSSLHSSSRTSQLSMTEQGTASSVPSSCVTTLGIWRETAWKRASTVLRSRPTACIWDVSGGSMVRARASRLCSVAVPPSDQSRLTARQRGTANAVSAKKFAQKTQRTRWTPSVNVRLGCKNGLRSTVWQRWKKEMGESAEFFCPAFYFLVLTKSFSTPPGKKTFCPIVLKS